MDSTEDKSHAAMDAVSPEPEASDPAYLAWKKAKIKAAIKEADQAPDDVLSEQEIWKKLGLDH